MYCVIYRENGSNNIYLWLYINNFISWVKNFQYICFNRCYECNNEVLINSCKKLSQVVDMIKRLSESVVAIDPATLTAQNLNNINDPSITGEFQIGFLLLIICFTVYCGDVLFCRRSVFIQASTECYITLESVWRGDFKKV